MLATGLGIRQEKQVKWSENANIGSHTRDCHQNASVILLWVTKAKHIVSEKTVSPCKKKKKKLQSRQRNKRMKLEVFRWQIINAFSLRNCKQAEKGLTWREGSKTWNKSFDAQVALQPQSTVKSQMQLGRLLTPKKIVEWIGYLIPGRIQEWD